MSEKLPVDPNTSGNDTSCLHSDPRVEAAHIGLEYIITDRVHGADRVTLLMLKKQIRDLLAVVDELQARVEIAEIAVEQERAQDRRTWNAAIKAVKNELVALSCELDPPRDYDEKPSTGVLRIAHDRIAALSKGESHER